MKQAAKIGTKRKFGNREVWRVREDAPNYLLIEGQEARVYMRKAKRRLKALATEKICQGRAADRWQLQITNDNCAHEP